MSLIFAGLQRLHFDLNDKAWSEISFKGSTLCINEVNIQSYPIIQERGDEEEEISKISHESEKVLNSSHNENLLDDVLFFIPQIFNTFGPLNGRLNLVQKYNLITNNLTTKKFVLLNDHTAIYDRGRPALQVKATQNDPLCNAYRFF